MDYRKYGDVFPEYLMKKMKRQGKNEKRLWTMLVMNSMVGFIALTNAKLSSVLKALHTNVSSKPMPLKLIKKYTLAGDNFVLSKTKRCLLKSSSGNIAQADSKSKPLSAMWNSMTTTLWLGSKLVYILIVNATMWRNAKAYPCVHKSMDLLISCVSLKPGTGACWRLRNILRARPRVGVFGIHK